jgi:hypothetical protein
VGERLRLDYTTVYDWMTHPLCATVCPPGVAITHTSLLTAQLLLGRPAALCSYHSCGGCSRALHAWHSTQACLAVPVLLVLVPAPGDQAA